MIKQHPDALTGLLVVGVLAATTYAHIGSCEDHTRSCRTWALRGLCFSSVRFMAQNCPVSCNLCLDPGCFDRSRHCSTWSRQGYCQLYQRAMKDTCPHSCNVCDLSPENLPASSRTIATPDFSCGIPADGANRPTRTGRRVARQIIFPNELQDFIDRLKLRKGGTSAPQQGNPQAVPLTNVGVDDSFCGATPIHERYLLTAAHCVLDPDRPVTTVRLGELDFSRVNEPNSQPADYQVERIIVHPDFKPNSVERYNDIALIQTVQKIEFNNVVYPFCIAETRPPVNSDVTGSGFGLVNNTHRAMILQEAVLKVVDLSECEASYESEGLGPSLRNVYPELLQGKDLICASFPGRSACEGDSGGPLFFDHQGRRFLVGIVGSGITCRGNGRSILPGLFISVADHIRFIDSVIYG